MNKKGKMKSKAMTLGNMKILRSMMRCPNL